MKKIDFLQFQLDYLNAAKEVGHDVYLSWGFSYDTQSVHPNNLEVVTDPNDGLKYWSIKTTKHGFTISKTLYLVDGCRILARSSYGRPLVNSDSWRLFLDALNASDIWQYEYNRRNDNNFSTANHVDLPDRSLSYSPINYAGDFQFNDPEVATFLPAGKPALIDATNKAVFDKFHQTQKIGKAVRYCLDCLGICYTDHHVETITNYIKAANMPIEFKYSSVEGLAISDVYDLEAAEGCGSLNSSCMRGHGDYYYDLDASDNVQVIYTTDPEGRLTSRALLWTSRQGTKLLDRIYGTDAMIEAYKKHALEAGYWHKEYQNYDSRRDWIDPDGDSRRTAFAVSINMDTSVSDERAPYMDTFCFYSVEQDLLTNDFDVANREGGEVYELRNTEGEAYLQ